MTELGDALAAIYGAHNAYHTLIADLRIWSDRARRIAAFRAWREREEAEARATGALRTSVTINFDTPNPPAGSTESESWSRLVVRRPDAFRMETIAGPTSI